MGASLAGASQGGERRFDLFVVDRLSRWAPIGGVTLGEDALSWDGVDALWSLGDICRVTLIAEGGVWRSVIGFSDGRILKISTICNDSLPEPARLRDFRAFILALRHALRGRREVLWWGGLTPADYRFRFGAGIVSIALSVGVILGMFHLMALPGAPSAKSIAGPSLFVIVLFGGLAVLAVVTLRAMLGDPPGPIDPDAIPAGLLPEAAEV